jgi:hypothetical protein
MRIRQLRLRAMVKGTELLNDICPETTKCKREYIQCRGLEITCHQRHLVIPVLA